jgi:hypothetical protein
MELAIMRSNAFEEIDNDLLLTLWSYLISESLKSERLPHINTGLGNEGLNLSSGLEKFTSD